MGFAGGFVTDLRTVLRGRGFRRLFAIRVCGQVGDGVFQVAMASYVFFSPERHATAPAAAQAFAVLLLPYSLVGPFAGVVLDRWRRRQVLLVANVVRGGLVVVVAGLVAGGGAGLALFSTALAVLSTNRFILAGLSASLPHVVPRHELVMANAVFPTSGTVAAMSGIAGGFLFRQLTGSDIALALATASLYLLAGLLALLLHKDLLGPDDPNRASARAAIRNVVVGLIDAGRHVGERRPAGWGLTVIGSHRFFYGISTVAMILLCRNYFHEPTEVDDGLATLATVLAVSGIGFLAAALATPVAARRMRKETWVLILLISAAVVSIVPGALFTLPAVLVAAFFLGVVAQGVKIVVDTLVQQNVDDAFRGRVFSFYDVLFNVSFVAAAMFAALTLPPSGKSIALTCVVSAGYALTALWYGRVTARASEQGSAATPSARPDRVAE
ncbi:MAG TPA: MFS transporter [Jiangellaceae bacterium]|nr:MFS transporter [Jiangellaceae bacterium]